MERLSGGTDPALKIVELQPQPTVSVRVQQPFAELDLPSLFMRYIPAVAQRAAELGATPAAPPFGRFHEFGPEFVDVEIGIGVAEPVVGLQPLATVAPGETGASELPGGPTGVVTHLGPYDTLAETYPRLREWLDKQGRTLGEAPWESYVDDPEGVEDVSELRTEIYWPLANAD